MRAPSVEPWEIDLQLPPGWFALSCDEATDRKEVPAKVARALRSTRLAATRKGLVGALLDWSTSARELGAACAAMRWQEHPTAGLGLASLMIKLFEREPVDVDKELARLRPALSEQLIVFSSRPFSSRRCSSRNSVMAWSTVRLRKSLCATRGSLRSSRRKRPTPRPP
ncbi:MAG TPA: hypothetical protein VF942_01280 [Acidimicrobiales bacterium]